jgi:hypothetical protein
MTERLPGRRATSRRTWRRAPLVVIGVLVPIALVALVCFRTVGRAAGFSAPLSAQAWATQATGSAGSADVPTTTVVASLVAATPLLTPAGSFISGMVVVSGRVSVADGGLVAGVVVVFQHSDCSDCVRYTATTNPSGRYRVSLPESRYRASCVPVGIRAYCFPVGASPDVSLDESICRVDFEIALLSSGRDGVGAHIGPPLPVPPGLSQIRRPWIVTPFHR